MDRSSLFAAVAFTALIIPTTTHAQSASNLSVHDDGRALAVVADILEQAFGVPVNYEDTLYRNSADMEDIQVEKYGYVTPGYHLFIPRRGAVLTTPASSDVEKLANIEAFLNGYRSAKLPGDYKVEQANDMFYIVPVKALTATGATVAVSSVMSQPVSFARERRTATDTIELVLNLAGQGAHVKVGLSTLLFWPTTMVEIVANGEPARDVLQRVVKAATGARVTYRLLSDPDPKGGPDYLMSMQYTGSSPWASNANVTGYVPSQSAVSTSAKPSVMTPQAPLNRKPDAPSPWFHAASPHP